jgi:transcription antitermination factor NusB
VKRARTLAREAALKVLYQLDLRGDLGEGQLDQQLGADLPNDDAVAFARRLIEGTREGLADLDAEIEAVAHNWTLERMAAIDRNVLRLGAYQLLHMAEDIPPAVAIDEAVSLAKAFSTKDSGAFVNGILDKILRRRDGATTPAADAADPAPSAEQDAS